ncbi:hypothetical protein [Frankia sp. R82]|uniref:hypothetical protein n=1 Tax=Frankia sp. R82 TaxID=2950553 RepID=UPI002044671B|nr:hypothetical protein [Frankia sp. R82]MCM3886224.1 hypothetical protein [Frankia sp. R82]
MQYQTVQHQPARDQTARSQMIREQAVFAARSRLADVRRRFLNHDLPSLGSLLVRHQIAVADTAEWPWARVTGWPHPALLRGRSLSDGAHPSLAHVRMGLPLRIHSVDIVDWAIIDARGEIAEGAWTRALRSPAEPPV